MKDNNKNDFDKANPEAAMVLEMFEDSILSINKSIKNGSMVLEDERLGVLTIKFDRISDDSFSNPNQLHYRIYKGKGMFKKYITCI